MRSPILASGGNGIFRSPLRYPGGKQRGIAQICEMFPKSAYEYRDPMVGGGSVFLAAKALRLAKKYWINDKFSELISFWKTIQDFDNCRKLQADLQQLRSRLVSADEIKEFYLEVREEKPVSIYRQALLFFFFNRVTFSGTTRAGGFSSAASLDRFTESSIHRLSPMPAALEGTKITELDFEEVILQPGEDVFIFLDPPYFTAAKLYGKAGSLHEFDHERLAAVLKKTRHRFLITYDDCAEVRSLYKGFAKIKTWELQYGMNNCNSEHVSKIGSELFISNYD